MTQILNFPESKPCDPLVGPFTEYRVVVEGRLIPNLTGWKEGDQTWLSVDRRFAISVPHELAHQVAWLLANAMAVASGYPWLGAESKQQPFAPKVTELGASTGEEQ